MLETLLVSIISGGATGLLGVVIQRVADFFNKKQDMMLNKDRMLHEVELRKLDIKILEKEWDMRLERARIEADAKLDLAETQVFASSFNEDPVYIKDQKLNRQQKWLMVALEVLRGSIRPMLTIYLCILTTLIYVHLNKTLGGLALEADQAMKLVQQLIATVLYLLTTCVLWYFGTRNKSSPPSNR